jgi:hypothetical protein
VSIGYLPIGVQLVTEHPLINFKDSGKYSHI